MSKTSKMGIAIGLSVGSFLLFFAVGEGLESSRGMNASELRQAVIGAVVMGLYFLLAQFLLSRGNPRAIHTDWWIILCLNSVLMVTALIAAVVEPNKGAVLQVALIAAGGVACAYAGAAIAARGARHRTP